MPQFLEWQESIARSMETGAMYSSSIPLSHAALCNNVGQRYHGPVTLITNALCYSTTDMFAAGFPDHAIGKIIGTDDRTGAGGANVVTRSDLVKLYRQVSAAADSVGNARPVSDLAAEQLPRGVDLRVAIRRSQRVRARSGVELEDLGVRVDVRHYITRNDVLADINCDLLATAAQVLLATKTTYQFHAVVTPDAAEASQDVPFTCQITARGIDRLDVSVNGSPLGSHPVAAGSAFEIPIPRPADKALERLVLRAYSDGTLLAARKFVVGRILKRTPDRVAVNSIV